MAQEDHGTPSFEPHHEEEGVVPLPYVVDDASCLDVDEDTYVVLHMAQHLLEELAFVQVGPASFVDGVVDLFDASWPLLPRRLRSYNLDSHQEEQRHRLRVVAYTAVVAVEAVAAELRRHPNFLPLC